MLLRPFIIALAVVNFLLVFAEVKKECKGMEIRDFEQLDKLANCTHILGSLGLVFPSVVEEEADYTAEAINNKSYPLREITGFFALIRVSHMYSIGRMFPNLTLIRGKKLLHNYAFIIYQTDLVEISLRNLLKINRGSVIIRMPNPRLCFPKIDWKSIIVNGKVHITLSVDSLNTPNSTCFALNFDRCHSCEVPGKCWHNGACQRFEKSFRSTHRQKSCHPLCLGDCSDRSASGCFVCKDISEDFKCVEECSADRLLNVETRRCVTKEDCLISGLLVLITPDKRHCVPECDAGYTEKLTKEEKLEKMEKSICRKCKKKCPKYCNPGEIRRMSQLDVIGIGCTIITGDLEIKITEDIYNLSEELEVYLGSVEEIQGSLKIHRSSQVTSLTFLNRLRVIEGRKDKPAVSIFENQNLQALLDWDARGDLKLEIRNGLVHIHDNIMLCSNETERFLSILKRTETKPLDFVNNNGWKRKCIAKTIKTSHTVLSHNACTIRWQDLKINNSAYVIQFAIVEHSRIPDKPFLLERDYCSIYGWNDIILSPSDWREVDDGYLEYNLTNLNQCTLYAFTVATSQYERYAIDAHLKTNEHDGALSEEQYFRTELRVLSRVKKIETLNTTSNSVTMQWKVLENEEIAITAFYIDVYKCPFRSTSLDVRNYCIEPIKDDEEMGRKKNNDDVEIQIIGDADCCEECCKKQIEGITIDLLFEQGLEELIYDHPKSFNLPNIPKNNPNFKERIEVSPQDRIYTINNLDPFSNYDFRFYACSGPLKDSKCSNYEMHCGFTNKSTNVSFDRIEMQPSSYAYENDDFHVHFEEPTLKNGAITNYIVELREIVGNNSIFLFSECITRLEHENNSFTYSIHNLLTGTYAFRVMAVSLAGKGQFTDYHIFHVLKPDHFIPTGWIALGVVAFSSLIGLIVALLFRFGIISEIIIPFFARFFRRYRIRPDRGHNDQVGLINDIEMNEF